MTGPGRLAQIRSFSVWMTSPGFVAQIVFPYNRRREGKCDGVSFPDLKAVGVGMAGPECLAEICSIKSRDVLSQASCLNSIQGHECFFLIGRTGPDGSAEVVFSVNS